jgi:hypothetical protein
MNAKAITELRDQAERWQSDFVANFNKYQEKQSDTLDQLNSTMTAVKESQVRLTTMVEERFKERQNANNGGMTTDIGLLHFTRAELACKSSGQFRLADGFGEFLDEVRDAWGKPLAVNSCCRSMAHNQAESGVKDSYHICDHPTRKFGTCAVDFTIGAAERRAFVAMILAKFPDASLGIAQTFMHVDLRQRYDGAPATLFTY